MYLSDFVPDAELDAMAEEELSEPPNQAYFASQRAIDVDLALEDFTVEDSWVLDDFDDLLPDHY